MLPYLVRGRKGRKMSKYVGNVIDPLEFIKGATLTKLKNKTENYNLSLAKVSRLLAD